MIETETLITLLPILNSIKNLSIFSERKKIKISAKHLVITSESAMQEFLTGDTLRLKGPKTESILLDENEIFKSAKDLYRPSFKWGKFYKKWEDTPVWEEKNKGEGLVYRKLNASLFLKELNTNDSLVFSYITSAIKKVDSSFNFSDYLQIIYHEDVCGGWEIIERYEFKPIFIVALWIENLSEEPLKLNSYKGKFYYPHDGLEFRTDSWGFGEEKVKELPNLDLKKGESLLIPELLLLGEIKEKGVSKPFLQFHRGVGEVLNFDIYENPKSLLIFGPSLSIEEIIFEKGSLKIHEFNSSNVLRLSKDYHVGSCPFLFGFDGEKFVYVKEILINSYEEEIDFSDFKYLIIAELKDEISYFDEIKLISDLDEPIILHKNIMLKKGDYLLIERPNENFKRLKLKGSYKTKYKILDMLPDMLHSKMRLIENFNISELNMKNSQFAEKILSITVKSET